MGRQQWNDRYRNAWGTEITPSNTANAVVNSVSFDTADCDSPTINLNVRSLASNKKIRFKLQHSDNNTTWTDVPTGVSTDAVATRNITANGEVNYYYAGESRYVRVAVTTVDASPGAKIDVLFQRHQLHSTPRNQLF